MTKEDALKRLLQWLRDAHAMEGQSAQLLERMGARVEHYPLLQKVAETHLDETRRHADEVKACIKRLGGDVSVLKDAAARFMGLAQGISGAFAGDEVVKWAMAVYTFEHMEIASYRIIASAAQSLGDTETKRVCEEILREEEAAAAELLQLLPRVAQTYLKRETADVEAAR